MNLIYLSSSPLFFEFFLFIISIGAGVFGAILGLGGGVILVPILTLGFGINIRYAIGASIVSVIATSSGSAATYVRDRITNIRVAILLEVATTFGALIGVALSTRFSEKKLFYIFSIILIYSAFIMLRKRSEHYDTKTDPNDLATKLDLHSSYPDSALKKEIKYSVHNLPLGFFLMAGAGVLSGLLGIGSGVLKVPAMDSAMKLPIKVSSATSSFMIGVTAAASASIYFFKGDILPMLAAPVALGVLTGASLGTKLMLNMKSQNIRKIFIFVLILISIQMALKAFQS